MGLAGGIRITNDPDLAVKIKSSEEHLFEEHNSSVFVADEGYPVDIKLWDGNYDISDGSDYYEDYEFLGWYQEGLFLLSGNGKIFGRLKGYGYIEYSVAYDEGLNTSGLSFSLGIVLGNFMEEHAEYPDEFPSGATVGTFIGEGTVTSIGGIGKWNSYDPDSGDVFWIGESYEYVGTSLELLNDFTNIVKTYIPSTSWILEEFINLSGFHTETTMLFDFIHQGGNTNTFYDCSY